MPYLNGNIPAIQCFVRAEFTRNLEEGHGEFLPAQLLAFKSLPGRAPLFHALFEDGSIYSGLPLHALCWKDDAPEATLEDLCLWDSFSYHFAVFSFDALEGKRVRYQDRQRQWHDGIYLFTIDWCSGDSNVLDVGLSESAGQSKSAHFIERSDGNYAMQPNNRVMFLDPNFTVKAGTGFIPKKLNTHEWSCERSPKWLTEDTDNFHYQMQEASDGKQPN